jgi:hypothetical protein
MCGVGIKVLVCERDRQTDRVGEIGGGGEREREKERRRGRGRGGG